MSDLHKAARQALEYLGAPSAKLWPAGTQYRIIAALHAALAQQAEPKGGGRLPPPLQAEPVAWRCACGANLYIDADGAPRSKAEPVEPVAVSVDALAQHIRFVDGNNNLGAGILAEKIVEFLIKLGIGKEQAEPVQEPQTLDAAMQQPRAMAQAYENGYKAGAAAEREACAKLAEATICDTHLPTGVRIYGTRVAESIRARGNT